MVFIWRGSGIAIPIFLAISLWLTSYAFDDTRFGNLPYVGWAMLWASIPLFLQALVVFGMNQPDEETGETVRSRHDFFFIPVWIWAIALLGGGIWLINM